MTASFLLRQKSFRNITDGKCLSVCLNLFFFPPNNTACFLPGRAKDLSAPPRTLKLLSTLKMAHNLYKSLKQHHNFIWQLSVATACRAVYRMKVVHSANRPHAR